MSASWRAWNRGRLSRSSSIAVDSSTCAAAVVIAQTYYKARSSNSSALQGNVQPQWASRRSQSTSAYAPGEKVEVGGKVVNDTKKDIPISIVLRQYVVLSSSGRSTTSSRSDFILSRGVVSAGGELDASSLSPCIMPHVFPSFSGGVEGPISRSFYPCLKWTYSIEVRAGSDKKMFATAIHSRIPILVSTAPPFDDS